MSKIPNCPDIQIFVTYNSGEEILHLWIGSMGNENFPFGIPTGLNYKGEDRLERAMEKAKKLQDYLDIFVMKNRNRKWRSN